MEKLLIYLNEVSKKMKKASIDLDFESAATYRDQLIGLRTIQERHMDHSSVRIWMS
jgi:excinuclease UvrABC nuclease subunit